MCYYESNCEGDYFYASNWIQCCLYDYPGQSYQEIYDGYTDCQNWYVVICVGCLVLQLLVSKL